jgi:hypothetical protein
MSNLRFAVFLHIQKTAGTTIVDLARQAYGNNNVISHGDYLKGISHFPFSPLEDRINKQVIDNFRKVPFLSGHFGYDFARQFMQDRHFFTFLREPVERVLSFYYFCRKRDPNEFRIYRLCQQTTLNEFLKMGLVNPEVKSFMWNNQVWQLAHGFGNLNKRYLPSFEAVELLDLARQHLNDFSYVGFAETFEKDRDSILKALGITIPKEKIVSNANPGRPVFKDLPQPTKNLLLELTELDRILYQEAWSRKNSCFENVEV